MTVVAGRFADTAGGDRSDRPGRDGGGERGHPLHASKPACKCTSLRSHMRMHNSIVYTLYVDQYVDQYSNIWTIYTVESTCHEVRFGTPNMDIYVRMYICTHHTRLVSCISFLRNHSRIHSFTLPWTSFPLWPRFAFKAVHLIRYGMRHHFIRKQSRFPLTFGDHLRSLLSRTRLVYQSSGNQVRSPHYDPPPIPPPGIVSLSAALSGRRFSRWAFLLAHAVSLTDQCSKEMSFIAS